MNYPIVIYPCDEDRCPVFDAAGCDFTEELDIYRETL